MVTSRRSSALSTCLSRTNWLHYLWDRKFKTKFKVKKIKQPQLIKNIKTFITSGYSFAAEHDTTRTNANYAVYLFHIVKAKPNLRPLLQRPGYDRASLVSFKPRVMRVTSLCAC